VVDLTCWDDLVLFDERSKRVEFFFPPNPDMSTASPGRAPDARSRASETEPKMDINSSAYRIGLQCAGIFVVDDPLDEPLESIHSSLKELFSPVPCIPRSLADRVFPNNEWN
jgi:hypothetical protein